MPFALDHSKLVPNAMDANAAQPVGKHIVAGRTGERRSNSYAEVIDDSFIMMTSLSNDYDGLCAVGLVSMIQLITFDVSLMNLILQYFASVDCMIPLTVSNG